MASIEVDPIGLLSLAGHCETHAARIASHVAPPPSGAGFQPSTSAVQAAHTEVAATSVRLAARLQDTAAAAAAAAGDMAHAEMFSAVAIAAADGSGVMAV